MVTQRAKSTRYIGITDFTSYDQVELMLDVWNMHRISNQLLQSTPKLHVGVMMSYKTLNDLPSKWLNVFPAKECIAGIFRSDEVMNCLHYADYDANDVIESLVAAVQYGGPKLHALQLDMVWPDPSAIVAAHEAVSGELEVILQINSVAMCQFDNVPHRVVKKLVDYRGLITHVLLDKSMGQGKGMDAVELLRYAKVIRQHIPELEIVFAGGLGPNSCDLIDPLVRYFSGFSVDAQGQLRSSGNALYPIEWERAASYMRKMLCKLK